MPIDSEEMKRTGHVWRIGPDGLGYVEESRTKNLFVLSLQDLGPECHSFEEFGISEGTRIQFHVIEGKVRAGSIQIARHQAARATR